MKKHIDLITYLFLGGIVVGSLSLLFYLTQANYLLLKQSNAVVIQTGKIVTEHRLLSGDFKNALIYYSTIKNSDQRKYDHIYSAGLWQISIDLTKLETMVNNRERAQLDSLSKQIEAQLSWMRSEEASDPQFADQRNQHLKNISAIQDFFDRQISELERLSIAHVKDAEDSLINLHNWIIAIIITSSVIIFITLLLIYLQLSRVKLQNKSLREIAWIQSHEVRAQVVILLGLSQLFNHENADDEDNGIIITGITDTANKLDEIVKKINKKAEV